jgi:uncharacterized protein (DUF488 family)
MIQEIDCLNSEASIYTIGYSTHSIESFISLLKANQIHVIADVRSQPYSRYKPEFSQKELKNSLQVEGLQYVFLGKELGARKEEPECFKKELGGLKGACINTA